MFDDLSGLTDTMWDLVVDTLGAALAGIFGWLFILNVARSALGGAVIAFGVAASRQGFRKRTLAGDRARTAEGSIPFGQVPADPVFHPQRIMVGEHLPVHGMIEQRSDLDRFDPDPGAVSVALKVLRPRPRFVIVPGFLHLTAVAVRVAKAMRQFPR